jgi:hypothetical protein
MFKTALTCISWCYITTCLEPESELEPVGEDILGLDLVLVQEHYLVVAAVQSSLRQQF